MKPTASPPRPWWSLKPDPQLPSLQTPMVSRRQRWIDQLVALLLGLATLVVLVKTDGMGFTRDEGFYFRAALSYIGWFDDLDTHREEERVEDSWTRENIEEYWKDNPEHPVLMKSAFALSYRTFARERDWLPAATAMRLPTMVSTAVLIWAMYLFMCAAFTRTAGLFACVAYLSMPRVFFHAHLACFDAAMVTMWFLVLTAYWKSLNSRTWAYITGVVFGLTLITKLNAFFLPPLIFLHWMWTGWADWRVDRSDRGVAMLQLPKVPLAFTTMAALGPLIMHWGWPLHWYDTFKQVAWYIERHLSHEHYAVYYFGDLLIEPPFALSFPFVMSWYTIPLVTMVAFALGLIALGTSTPLRCRLTFVAQRLRAVLGGAAWVSLLARLRAPRDAERRDAIAHRLREWTRPGGARPERAYTRDPRGTLGLMALGMLLPFIIIARPDTPIFGGTKHWMTGMPYFACFAGIGFAWMMHGALAGAAKWLKALHRPLVRNTLVLAALPLVLWPSIRATAHSHPYGTSYYNELMGGYVGAADRKMHRQFWGYTSRHAADWINAHAPKNASIHIHNMFPNAFDMYKRDGIFRKDLRPSGSVRGAHYVLYHHQNVKRPFLFGMWHDYKTTSPAFVVSIDGVPLLSVYENPFKNK